MKCNIKIDYHEVEWGALMDWVGSE